MAGVKGYDKEGRGIIRYQLDPVIITFATASDVKNAVMSSGEGRGKIKGGVEDIALWLDNGEKPTIGVALIQMEKNNRITLAILVDRTDLSNDDLFKNTHDKFIPVPIDIVGARATASDILNGNDQWLKTQETIREVLGKGEESGTETGENDLGIRFVTYKTAGDVADIVDSLAKAKGPKAFFSSILKGSELVTYLHIKGIPVWVVISYAKAKNLYLATVLFDKTNLRGSKSKRFSEQKKLELKVNGTKIRGLTAIPVRETPSLRVNWKVITGNVNEIYDRGFDKQQAELARTIKERIKKIEDDEEKFKFAIETLIEGRIEEL
ncbi:hypothetical protein GF352_01830|nr:hypothetical protein [archaeon]